MTATAHHATVFMAHTAPRSLLDVTDKVQSWVDATGVASGVLTLFIQHTSASLVIQENADPDVQADLIDALAELAPESRAWRHDTEGPDDMPAHVKAALTATSLSIPVVEGRLALGTWQAIYVAEHRAGNHLRRVAAHLTGV